MSIFSSDTVTLAESVKQQYKPQDRPIRGQGQVLKDYIETIANLDDPHSLYTDPNVAELAHEYKSSYKEAQSQTTKTLTHDAEVAFVLNEVKGLASAICNRSEWLAANERIPSSTSIKLGYCLPSFWSYCLEKSKETGHSTLIGDDTSFRGFLLYKDIDWLHVGAIREGKDYLARNFLCSLTIVLQFAVKLTVQADWLDAFVCVDTAPSKSPLSLSWTLARRDPQVGRMTADVVVLVAMGCAIHKRMAFKAENESYLERLWAKADRKALSSSRTTQFKDEIKRAFLQLLRSPMTRRRQTKEAKAKKREVVKARAAVREAARELKYQGERYAQCIENRASQEERRFVFQSIQQIVLRIFAKSQPSTDWSLGREPSVPKTLSRAVEELGEEYK